ncbi:MAG TPA: riboflavin deaminase [Richelia sp.]|nr:riboflavin deaminase [Richelia sp.]
MLNRPYITAVLAMSVDGKIADTMRAPARFTSRVDKMHLEEQIAATDAVLFGAGTLRAYGTTLTISHPQLLHQRRERGKPPQPIHMVVSNLAQIDPNIRFFYQSIPRWLLTSSLGAQAWKVSHGKFEKILVLETFMGRTKLIQALKYLTNIGISKLVVLGGGNLIGEMMELDLIDEFWLTVCPLVLGGKDAPTPVEGKGFLSKKAPHLELLTVHQVEHDVFLHYRVKH